MIKELISLRTFYTLALALRLTKISNLFEFVRFFDLNSEELTVSQ